jgi:hypothetical protein
MSTDEEIVYDFTTELQKNKRVSDPTFNRAEQRFGKKGVVDMTGISGYYTFLAMQLNMARYEFSGAANLRRHRAAPGAPSRVHGHPEDRSTRGQTAGKTRRSPQVIGPPRPKLGRAWQGISPAPSYFSPFFSRAS